jgi:hypothetical protein
MDIEIEWNPQYGCSLVASFTILQAVKVSSNASCRTAEFGVTFAQFFLLSRSTQKNHEIFCVCYQSIKLACKSFASLRQNHNKKTFHITIIIMLIKIKIPERGRVGLKVKSKAAHKQKRQSLSQIAFSAGEKNHVALDM